MVGSSGRSTAEMHFDEIHRDENHTGGCPNDNETEPTITGKWTGKFVDNSETDDTIGFFSRVINKKGGYEILNTSSSVRAGYTDENRQIFRYHGNRVRRNNSEYGKNEFAQTNVVNFFFLEEQRFQVVSQGYRYDRKTR